MLYGGRDWCATILQSRASRRRMPCLEHGAISSQCPALCPPSTCRISSVTKLAPSRYSTGYYGDSALNCYREYVWHAMTRRAEWLTAPAGKKLWRCFRAAPASSSRAAVCAPSLALRLGLLFWRRARCGFPRQPLCLQPLSILSEGLLGERVLGHCLHCIDLAEGLACFTLRFADWLRRLVLTKCLCHLFSIQTLLDSRVNSCLSARHLAPGAPP